MTLMTNSFDETFDETLLTEGLHEKCNKNWTTDF